MSDAIDAWVNGIHQGDAAETLAELPASSVHCCITSPPYYLLRDYGEGAERVWDDGWEGQLGLESTVELYMDHLMEAFRQVKRVLRPDGVLWANIDDKYATSDRGNPDDHSSSGLHGGDITEEYAGTLSSSVATSRGGTGQSAKRKSMFAVPERFVLRMLQDGWVYRTRGVWDKTSHMPGPWEDRLVHTWEPVYMFTPEPDYWWDLDAIREPHKKSSIQRAASGDFSGSVDGHPGSVYPGEEREKPLSFETALHPRGKNPGDMLRARVAQYSDAHYSVFSEDLVVKPIESSCPPRVCAACGTPHERVKQEGDIMANPKGRRQKEVALEKYRQSDLIEEHLRAIQAVGFNDTGKATVTQTGAGKNDDHIEALAAEAKAALGGYFREFVGVPKRPVGWKPACDCDTDATEPGIVIDPFAGRGTVGKVASQRGRRYVLIDLDPDSIELAENYVPEGRNRTLAEYRPR